MAVLTDKQFTYIAVGIGALALYTWYATPTKEEVIDKLQELGGEFVDRAKEAAAAPARWYESIQQKEFNDRMYIYQMIRPYSQSEQDIADQYRPSNWNPALYLPMRDSYLNLKAAMAADAIKEFRSVGGNPYPRDLIR